MKRKSMFTLTAIGTAVIIEKMKVNFIFKYKPGLENVQKLKESI
jgi:hypothetical protein